ncbi:MAG TPA: glycine cleavage system protein H [Acidimicrobiia bacterium]|jgi:glycine cleavage system H protein|nr:glycine cleavage system protein H [Acidimicrobiia bacterium]
MPDVRGCQIPDHLHYWPEKHVWATFAEGMATVGITDVAQHLAKTIISALPKEAGRPARKGKSLGTVESGKWVGPVTSPIDGEVVEANRLLATDPGILNRDPYGEGWFVRIRPDDWPRDAGEMVTGDAGVAAYRAFLEEEGISCE